MVFSYLYLWRFIKREFLSFVPAKIYFIVCTLFSIRTIYNGFCNNDKSNAEQQNLKAAAVLALSLADLSRFFIS